MTRAALSARFAPVFGAALAWCALSAMPARAQLKDGTPAERDLMVWAAISIGTFGNSEQVAFDARLRIHQAGRAALTRVTVAPVTGSNVAAHTLFMRDSGGKDLILVPVLDAGPSTIRLKVYQGGMTESACDLYMTREAGQFRAVTRATCGTSPNEILFSQRAIWTRNADNQPFAKMIRARQFECYVDMPGSGGINGEAFKRFDALMLDDQGGEAWFTTNEATPRELGLRLRSVNWAMNNKPGTFSRNSLTLYLMERRATGDPKLLTYAWSEPQVTRIGLNAQWALANCFMEANSLARPEF